MHVRSTTVMGDPTSIEDGVAYLRDKVMQTLQTTEGCLGLSMLADRQTGRCIASTAVDDASCATASANSGTSIGRGGSPLPEKPGSSTRWARVHEPSARTAGSR